MEELEETWRSIEGYEGRYEVSNSTPPRCRSMPRSVSHMHGSRRRVGGKVLKTFSCGGKWAWVHLSINGKATPCRVDLLRDKAFPEHKETSDGNNRSFEERLRAGLD
jgi:NUMOD4 motif